MDSSSATDLCERGQDQNHRTLSRYLNPLQEPQNRYKQMPCGRLTPMTKLILSLCAGVVVISILVFIASTVGSSFASALFKKGENVTVTPCWKMDLNDLAKNYDVSAELARLGGLPGKIEGNVKKIEGVRNLKYSYRSSDLATFIRLEDAYYVQTEHDAEVRGELWWAPFDFNGCLRHATYYKDGSGFSSHITNEVCTIQNNKKLVCMIPSQNPLEEYASSPVAKDISAMLKLSLVMGGVG